MSIAGSSMSISIVCTHCGKGLKVNDAWVGRRATCPGCKQTFVVPAPDAVAVGAGAAAPSAAAAPRIGATRYDPAAAAGAKADREREKQANFTNTESYLPWQY